MFNLEFIFHYRPSPAYTTHKHGSARVLSNKALAVAVREPGLLAETQLGALPGSNGLHSCPYETGPAPSETYSENRPDNVL